jgi:hypothetical protein
MIEIMDKQMQEKLERLRSWSDTLARKVVDVLPQMESTLNGNTRLPENCPSKESAAELELRDIKGALDEVNAAFAAIKEALLKAP